ncbi:MAG: methyltransferase type 11 [Parcubacteria group bacterium]|nr:methyltransferase type 11 [Parcubacteria group bacterium]|tara:strand:- start:6364 stop:7212 length:849 start_codon:yes stop_codon:yes gene_type:complete
MDQKQQEQLEQQRQTWDKFSAGWKKWDELLMSKMRPVSEALIDSLTINDNDSILDVASGTGEPGLTLAKKFPNARVTGSDLSEQMVKIANEHAKQRNIANYFSVHADASNMPSFEDNQFDGLICRFGIMFMPDLDGSLKEMVRVVKLGATFSVAVWAAPQFNDLLTTIGKIVRHQLNIPEPPVDVPGIFRCAQEGFTSGKLETAGLNEVKEFEIEGVSDFDSPEHYWEVMSDIAGPIMDALKKADEETQQVVKKAVLEAAEKFVVDGKVKLNWKAIIATGIK